MIIEIGANICTYWNLPQQISINVRVLVFIIIEKNIWENTALEPDSQGEKVQPLAVGTFGLPRKKGGRDNSSRGWT